MKIKNTSVSALMSLVLFLAPVLFVGQTEAKLLFSTESDLIVDQNDLDTDNFTLSFGDDLASTLRYNVTNDNFVFNKEVDLENNFNVQGTSNFENNLNVEGPLTNQLTGNVSVTISQAAVTGVGTLFTSELGIGDSILIDGEESTVIAIADDTNLTLSINHTAGATGADIFTTEDLTVDLNGNELIDFRAENASDADSLECTGAVHLGRIYYNTDDSDLLYCAETSPSTFQWVSTSSSAVSNISETFYAEFANFSLLADGSNNVGTFTSGYDDADDRSFYTWSTLQTTNQDYDLVFQWQVPSNFSDFSGTATDVGFDIETLNTNSQIDLVVEQNGTPLVLAPAQSANTAGTWATVTAGLPTATVLANDTLTFKFKMQANDTDASTASLSNLKINYDVL